MLRGQRGRTKASYEAMPDSDGGTRAASKSSFRIVRTIDRKTSFSIVITGRIDETPRKYWSREDYN